MSWIRPVAGGIELTLRIQPRASRSGVAGELGDALKIRLQAPPVDGKANEALVSFLAEALNVPRRNVALVSGESSRGKRVTVAGVTEAAARAALIAAT